MAEDNTSTTGFTKQIISSVIISFVAGQFGLFSGWLSPMTLLLRSENSPFGPMTKNEIANLASFPNYSAVPIIFIVGIVAKTFGRKPAVYLVAAGGVIGSVLIRFATSIAEFVHLSPKILLFAGRMLSCISAAGVSLAPMYISETVNESIRGSLMSLSQIQINMGILVAYTLGKVLSFEWFNNVFIAFPIAYGFLAWWLPESPHFLVEKGRGDEATASLLWLRSGRLDVAQSEMETIMDGRKDEEEKLNFSQVIKSRSFRAAIGISALLYAFQTFSGIHAVLNYAALIFKESGSALDPDDSSIVMASLLLASSFVSIMVIDKVGRKPLLYFSFVGNAISLAALTMYLYRLMKGSVSVSLNWIPVSTVSLFVFVYGCGLASVPGALANELSSTSVRPVVGPITAIVVIACLTLVLQSFPYLDDHVGLYSAFAIPTFVNLIGIFFVWLIVPETKGKTFADIQKKLQKTD